MAARRCTRRRSRTRSAALELRWSADVDHWAFSPLVTVGADGAVYLVKPALEAGRGGSRLEVYALDARTGARLAPPQLVPGPNPPDTLTCNGTDLPDELLGGLVAPRDGRILIVTTRNWKCGELLEWLVLTWYDPVARTFVREEHHISDLHDEVYPRDAYYVVDAQLTEDDELVLSWPTYSEALVWHIDPQEPTRGWFRNLSRDVAPGIHGAATVAYHPEFGYYVGNSFVDGGDVLVQRYLFVARYDHH